MVPLLFSKGDSKNGRISKKISIAYNNSENESIR